MVKIKRMVVDQLVLMSWKRFSEEEKFLKICGN